MKNGIFSLLVWAWLMASSFIVSANMDAFASPIATSVFRFSLALMLIFGALVFQWQASNLTVFDGLAQLLGSWRVCLQYALISGALVGFFIGLFIALKYTKPLNTAVLYTFVPIFGLVIGIIWLKEALNLMKLAGFLLGSIGACVVLFSSQGEVIGAQTGSMFSQIMSQTVNFDWNKGDMIFLFACVLLSIHVMSVQKWGTRLAPLSGAFMIMLFGVIWLIPIAIIWGDLDKVAWSAMGFWVNGLYLTVFTTLLTFILQQRLVLSVGASRLLAFSYSIPVWVACYTAFSSGQIDRLFNLGFIIGLIILLLAYCLIETKSLKAHQGLKAKVNPS
jgi:drug/metabolite transporter (DMT)-like permease